MLHFHLVIQLHQMTTDCLQTEDMSGLAPFDTLHSPLRCVPVNTFGIIKTIALSRIAMIHIHYKQYGWLATYIVYSRQRYSDISELISTIHIIQGLYCHNICVYLCTAMDEEHISKHYKISHTYMLAKAVLNRRGPRFEERTAETTPGQFIVARYIKRLRDNIFQDMFYFVLQEKLISFISSRAPLMK